MGNLTDFKERGFKDFRWFFTSSGKLVVGGKNAKSNDELVILAREFGKDFIVMHTKEPGSSFSIILDDIKKVNKNDKMECAIFTACFSKEWKSKKDTSSIHCFTIYQTYKLKNMPQGTWGIEGKVNEIIAPLSLILTKQQGILRAVPQSVVKIKSKAILRVKPGEKDKQELLLKLKKIVGKEHSDEEILSALPAGGITLEKI